VSVITKLGVETSVFVAAIGAAGLAIGLSLQGSLANFAGGLLIILFIPLRVGDYIEAQGESGTVAAIFIFSTKIITPSTNPYTCQMVHYQTELSGIFLKKCNAELILH
jgi:small conductance mechanosensitive channel